MKNNHINWKTQDSWNLNTFILLILLEYVIGVGVIKMIIQPLYEDWFGSDLYAGTFMGLNLAILLTLGVFFIALKPQKLSWRAVGIKPFEKKDWKMIIFYSLILFVGTIVIALLTSLLTNEMDNSKTEAVQENITFFTVFIAFVSAAIISPIYEEIFYRGFMYRWLRTRIGLKGAILLSALIFSVAHFPSFSTMPAAFFAGIIFALAYEHTGSIIPSMLIHGISNGIMMVITSLA